MSLTPAVSDSPAQGSAAAPRQKPGTPGTTFSQLLSGEIAQQRSAANAAEATVKEPTDSPLVLQAGTAPGEAGKRAQPNDPAHEEIGAAIPVDDTPMPSPTELLALAINLGLVVQKPVENNATQPVQPELPGTAMETGTETTIPVAAGSALPLQPEPADTTILDTAISDMAMEAGAKTTIPVMAGNTLPSPSEQAAAATMAEPANPIALALSNPPAIQQPDQTEPDKDPGTSSLKPGMQMSSSSAGLSENPLANVQPEGALPVKPETGLFPAIEGAKPQAAIAELQSAKTGEPLPTQANAPAMNPVQQARPESVLIQGVTPQYRLAPPVGTTTWPHALGERISWMVAGAQQTASLTLNPPDLGPLQIVLNISNDQASAEFFSAHPEVRHAIETALPKLREMMDEAGIQLGQTTVSADMPKQNDNADRQARQNIHPFSRTDSPASAGQTPISPTPSSTGRGLLDTYA